MNGKKKLVFILLAVVLAASVLLIVWGVRGFVYQWQDLDRKKQMQETVRQVPAQTGKKNQDLEGAGMERQETGEPGEPAIPGAFGKTGQETGMDIPEEVPQDGSQDAPEAEVPAKVKFIQTDDRSGLPQEVCSVIDAINAGEDLKTATGLDTVEEYCALTAVHIILAVDPKTEEETTGSGRLQMYVPNLLAGLEDVSGLFFDRGTAEWSVIPVDFADAAGKRVAVTVPGSGALTIVYRKGQ